jgi:hypothetical protein
MHWLVIQRVTDTTLPPARDKEAGLLPTLSTAAVSALTCGSCQPLPMSIGRVHQHRHERRGCLEASNPLAEFLQRFGLSVETLDRRKVGPDGLVHRTHTGTALVGEKGFKRL